MAKSKTRYKCTKCGKIHQSWVGKCMGCGEWNTIEEIVETPQNNTYSGPVVKPVKAASIKRITNNRIDTGNSEINRMFGGGIVNDSVSIISAPPGAGKSTFATYLCGILCEKGFTVLYASGEESESQIKSRIDRVIGNDIPDNMYILSDPQKKFESVAEAVN